MSIKNKAIVYLLFVCLVLFSCNTDYNVIQLKRIDLNNENRFSIKTIKEINPEVSFARIDRGRGIDDFTIRYIFIKKARKKQLVYQIETSKDIVLFGDSFAVVEQYNGAINYGWFFLENEKEGRLPLLDHIMDSLKTIDDQCFIQNQNGYLLFYQNSHVKKTINYGNCIFKDQNFDELEYGLYKVENENVELISKNGNELKNQKNGLFFIPSPGYGVIAQYPMQNILAAIDSVFMQYNPPENISVKMDKDL